MKGIKIYLVIVTLLLIVAIGFGVYTWLMVQKLTVDVGDAGTESGTSVSSKDVSNTETGGEEPIVIQTADLTSAQRATLETFGFNGETITITEAMITCAKDAVGEARFTEILNGGAPTPFESMKLLPCMKK
jgi:anionic cell wall polymer biosynthesis LytR-Cps2A-Psr (LCP) family protein